MNKLSLGVEFLAVHSLSLVSLSLVSVMLLLQGAWLGCVVVGLASLTSLGAAAAATSGQHVCNSDLDCELNGVCDGSLCRCHRGWTGPSCGLLDLMPIDETAFVWPKPRPLPPMAHGQQTLRPQRHAPKPKPLGSPIPTVPISWGATYATDPSTKQSHMFVDTCCYNPESIMHDSQGCQIIHTTGNTPMGPFSFAGIALGPNNETPHVKRYVNGTWLMYFAGTNQQCNVTCTGQQPGEPLRQSDPLRAGASTALAPCNGTGMVGFNVATAEHLNGPWHATMHLQIPGLGDSQNINPSPLVLPNGTVWVAYTDHGTGPPEYAKHGERIGIAVADRPEGPYQKLGGPRLAIFEHQCEDPFLFQSPGNGAFHILCHNMVKPNERTNWVGIHAFSKTGGWGDWQVSPQTLGPDVLGAYSANVTWANGTVTPFYRRERPELLFDADGNIAALSTGVELYADHPDKDNNHQYSYTLLQRTR
eukprot:m.98249 g.98249  ORF g.98249 m.98249 type:complete len:475 (-) comp15269_c0_seq2:41-1465(-)